MAVVTTSTRSTFEPVKFKLSGQIVTHKNGPTDEITLAMPSAAAFLRYGQPFSRTISGKYPDQQQRFDYNFPAIMGFLQEMTGHDEIVLSGIPGNDMIPLADAVIAIVSFRPETPKAQLSISEGSEKS